MAQIIQGQKGEGLMKLYSIISSIYSGGAAGAVTGIAGMKKGNGVSKLEQGASGSDMSYLQDILNNPSLQESQKTALGQILGDPYYTYY